MKKDNFKIDFVGIGAMKAATTWIYECLQEHPEIELAPKDQEDKVLFFKENPSSEEMEEYKSWFNQENTIKGDFHVHYLESEDVIERMKHHNPDIKIVVCLRNPIDRAYSHYFYNKFHKDDYYQSFEKALEEESDLLELGLYFKHLKKYFESFPKENIQVLLFKEMKENNEVFLRRIYRFLGVDDEYIPDSLDTKVNPTSFKNTKLGKFIHKKILAPFLLHTKFAWKLKKSTFVKKTFLSFTNSYTQNKKDQPPMRQETREKLQEYYKEDINQLEGLINKDLSHWKQ